VNRPGPNPHAFAEDWEFSQSILADGAFVYTSGQGGFGPDGEVVDPDDFEAQLRQAYANLAAVLEAAGASLDTVVKTTVYLARVEDYDTFRRVRHEMFTPPYPASTAIQGRMLFEGMLVEMDAVARVGEKRSAG
jgi:2-iminobutanoate/2-iminopropanoate deaminase